MLYLFAPPASGLTITLFRTSKFSRIHRRVHGSAYRLSTGTLKNPWIWLACRSIVITWLHPAVCSIFAINFAVIGARDLSFLSCRAYGKFGITAVMRRAEAVLHALIMIRSSMRPSLMSPGAVDCSTNTGGRRGVRGGCWFWGRRGKVRRGEGGRRKEGTVFVADGLADCDGGFLVGVLEDHNFGQFYAQSGCALAAFWRKGFSGGLYLSATSLASWGWLLPVSSFIELVAMVGVGGRMLKAPW